MQDKYISFEPWWAGYTNVRMSFELAIAISEVTGRKLIVQPNIYFNGINDWHNVDSYRNIFDLWDRRRFFDYFNCVDYDEIPEYKKLANGYGYYWGIEHIAKVITFSDKYAPRHPLKEIGPHEVMADMSKVTDQEDFRKFQNGRKVINLDLPDKFIHFPRNLFGHFFFHVYANSPSKRNGLKRKILDGIAFQKKYYQLAKPGVDKLKEYNALHIRQGDFLVTRPDSNKHLNNIHGYLDQHLQDKTLPIYIATDESDKSKFETLQSKYKLHFREDLNKSTEPFEQIALDYIYCSYAKQFLGSRLSTFSDYIHVNRASLDKPTVPSIYSNHSEITVNYEHYPWLHKQWAWHDLTDFYWKPEKDTKSIFLNIASYRDSDLINTINSAFQQAAFPERIKIGVFLQDEQEELDKLINIPNVTTLFTHWKDTRGRGWARNRINKELYNNEDYFMMVDSHSRFKKHWDVSLIEQVDRSPENSIMTGFPPDFRFHIPYEEYSTSRWLTVNRVKNFVTEDNFMQNTPGHVPGEDFVKTVVVSAGNIVGRGHTAQILSYEDNEDEYINPYTEQEIYSCLAYIRGYDFVVPIHANVWHSYEDNTDKGTKKWRPLIFEDKHLTGYIKNPQRQVFSKYETKRTVQQWYDRVQEDIDYFKTLQ